LATVVNDGTLFDLIEDDIENNMAKMPGRMVRNSIQRSGFHPRARAGTEKWLTNDVYLFIHSLLNLKLKSGHIQHCRKYEDHRDDLRYINGDEQYTCG
jgi:hypothetical protein